MRQANCVIMPLSSCLQKSDRLCATLDGVQLSGLPCPDRKTPLHRRVRSIPPFSLKRERSYELSLLVCAISASTSLQLRFSLKLVSPSSSVICDQPLVTSIQLRFSLKSVSPTSSVRCTINPSSPLRLCSGHRIPFLHPPTPPLPRHS